MNNIIHIIQHTARTATVLLLALLTAQTAWATDLTDFLTVSSSGTASGYFAFSDHFYRVDWTGINTSQTTSVQLIYNPTYGYLKAQTNGDTSGDISLATNADFSAHWKASDITGLTPGQSSDGYTTYAALSANAGTKGAKVCTVTCVAALKPKWNWSSDHSTCTATFMCAENTSLTATVNATVTSSSEPYAANVTFNGTSYSYVAPVTYSITYVLNGGINAASNPNTYRDDETVTLSDPMRTGYVFEGWYDNSGFSGTAVTGIPYDSSGDKTFYAKWKSEVDGLTYDATIGGFIIDSSEALNTLATYSQSNNCSGKTFKQTADIALSGNFTGIGCYDHPFSGTYDGGNHYITGLYEKQYVNYLGLFLMTNGATISNVRLVSPYIDSSNTAGTKFGDGIGGLIGTSTGTTVSNCYVLDPTLKGNSSSTGAIIGGKYNGSCTGCYYYSESGTINNGGSSLVAVGRNGESVTAPRLRKLTLPGSVTGGSVTASSGVQLNYNSTLYCAENASVTLTITPEKGYILSALTVNGTDVTGSVSNNSYTFNMPTEDITVTAAFVKETFTYVDMNGVTQTVEAERITSDSDVGLYSGWYAVGGNVTRNRGFNLVGNGVVINIILCDGATLSLPNSTINTAGGGKPNLVIWGQENGTGTLSCLSISDQVTSVTVNGGKLYCGVSNYNCAINGNLNVNGGEVHLTAGFNTCVNGSVTYNGGILDTKKISGNTTLNWSNAATDRVKASEYSGSVTIADGKFFKDAGGNYYYGSLTDAQKTAIKNVELQPSPNAHFITVNAAVHGAATTPAVAESGNTVTVTVAPDKGYKVASVKYNNTDATKADDTHFTFTMPASNVTVTASCQPITYTITYNNVEGATFAASNPVSYTVESEAITLNNPIKTGYTFGGWTGTDLDGITQTVTIPSGSNGDRAYTANWTAHTYSVQFNGNGATDGEMSAQSFTYDEPKELTANAYTRTGYTFTGWNTAADGTGTAYTDGQTVQNLTAENGAAVILYAQWTANTYTVHFVAGIPVHGEMADQTFTYDQEATALTKNAFSTTTGQWLRWNTEADGSGTNYEDEALVQNLTAEDGGVVTLYAQWRLQHRFNYDNTIFRCYNVGNSNQVYWAYAGETVMVEVIDGTSEYTIRVVNGDGETITLDAGTNTFVMPNEEVWITYTSVKKMAYTTICLDDFDSWDDVAYLYDASQPTVTPTVVVKDGETVLTEGTDYTVEITNNTGSATQMVTATVTVTGMGGYVGTNTVEFRITPFNIANCEIKGMEAYDDGYGVYYPLERNVQVWNGDTKLEVGTDYSLDVESADSYVVGQFYNATVKGTGDWGGSKTFQFKVVELHHTVVFVANGGSGTMASDVATKGQHYTLPACGFTAPDGKVFDHWVASCEPDAEKQPGDYFTAPYIWNESDVQTITVTAYWRDALILLNDDSAQPEGSKNADIIAANNGTTGLTVQLQGRTLYKDGSWNTLCLPFSVSTASGTLSGDNVQAMTLNTTTSNLADGTLTLNFTAAETIPAGTPFIIKWDNTGDNIENPVFDGVTVSNAKHDATIEGVLTFTGTYAPVSIGSEGDNTKLYLGSANKLYHPNAAMTIGTHRAYFQLAPGITAGEPASLVRAFVLNFGEDDATGIVEPEDDSSFVTRHSSSQTWYTLDGRKLDGRPTQRGIYIYNGKKTIIK